MSMRTMMSTVVLLLGTAAGAMAGLGLPENIVVEEAAGAFPVVADGTAAELWHDSEDWKGVVRAIGDLQMDVERVTGCRPQLATRRTDCTMPIIIGTLGKSSLIDMLAARGMLDDSDLKGKWESFVITTVANPMPGVEKALVIAGSDKRGTIYGIYELSEQMGVSPWYWWADVPPKKRAAAYVRPGRYASGEPVVKYRGIFINDEEPCFGPWAREKFGGINSKMYSHMFELILRMRGNYLWPAMWGKAFNEDDPMNPVLADEYGIVMGTSHHEPMIRAQEEWTKRKATIGNGEWNYATNEDGLRGFWEEGIQRNKDFESIVTIGMRGDGDMAMIEGGDMEDNVELLEKIVDDQRKLIADNMNPDVTQVPQMWALYKEVMDYYEHGMRVPDDVTLLWCDDNWGNIRRLPTPEERKRSGGAGIYYHFDYVGGPRCYKWLNCNPLPRIWEQMNLAYEYDATRIWIVNVGDLKPMELPIEFFLRMAWNPEALPKEKVAAFTQAWAAREFGAEHAEEIADLTSQYLKMAAWRKPELLEPNTFSLTNGREAERVSNHWNDLLVRAEAMDAGLSDDRKDAFFQLVLHPIKAMTIITDMYIATGRNRLYAEQGRVAANAEAETVRTLFAQDQALSDFYNSELAGGKWNHMMNQTHIGYTSWRDPVKNVMPEVTEIDVPDSDAFGVAVEGSRDAWPGSENAPALPPFDSISQQQSTLEVFARGSRPVDVRVTARAPWISVKEDSDFTGPDKRFFVSIDWDKAPEGTGEGLIAVIGENETVDVGVTAVRASAKQLREATGCFGGLVGPVSIAPEQAAKNTAVRGVRWEAIPDYGRYEAGMSIFPTTAESVLPPERAPTLEYPVFIAEPGEVTVDVLIGSTLNFVPGRGLRLAVSIDDEKPQVLDAFPKIPENYGSWADSVRDNARTLRSTHQVSDAGRHTLKIMMVDPGVVLQKVILYRDPLPGSYFGPLNSSVAE